jgi:hypothetical protein
VWYADACESVGAGSVGFKTSAIHIFWQIDHQATWKMPIAASVGYLNVPACCRRREIRRVDVVIGGGTCFATIAGSGRFFLYTILSNGAFTISVKFSETIAKKQQLHTTLACWVRGWVT